MWMMLQHHEPDDFELSTGQTQSIRDFLGYAFEHLDLDWQDYVKIDPRYFRPTEVDLLLGDCTKAREKLGWTAKTSCRELAQLMVDSDMQLAKQEAVHASLNES
jgi:GDPmannose 4,6-dehydratase